MISGDALRLRAGEHSHWIEHTHADGALGHLRVVLPGSQAGAVSALNRYITFSASKRR